MSHANNLIGKSNGVHHLYKNNGNTHDIIQAIVYADKFCAPYTEKLAISMRGRNLEETCYNIWKFWKGNVRYKEDPDGVQYVKSPGYLYEVGEGDCKSYSVAIASCLKNNGINYFYRFITETKGKDYHHVYVVVPSPDGEIIIDCVLDEFNKQNAFAAKKDLTPPVTTKAKIGKVGATVNEVVSASWEDYERSFKNRIGTLKSEVRAQGIAEIKARYPNGPVIRKKAVKAFEENLDNMTVAHYCLIYLYWDNSKAPFPTGANGTLNLHYKRNTGLEVKQKFQEVFGFSDNIVQKFAQLACYHVHGITMEYMLYRCYNMLKYGQPWEPVPGIPYFDITRNSFDMVGGDKNSPEFFKQCLLLGSCFPAGGGISRPFGVPYLSTVGYYMQNGCEETKFKEWRRTYKGNTTELERIEAAKYLISQQFTNEEPAARFARAYRLYQDWRSGNMVALPNVDLPKKGAAIGDGGLGVGAIVAIVVACITAVGTIISIIGNIVGLAQGNAPQGVNMPNPPADFQMEYQSVDGCYIGVAPQECGNMKAKYCLDGTFTCLTDADMLLPQNQPGMPQDGFGVAGSNKLLLLGGAALVLLGLLGSSSKSSAA